MESVKDISKSSLALLNEYKGNIFEFLVAQKISQKFSLESQLLASIDPSFFKILEQQQLFILNNYPSLYKILPVWSEDLVTAFFETFSPGKVSAVKLIGKLVTSETAKYGSADILLERQISTLGLSIKLARSGTYINSKSSGVKSFFTKYFGGEFLNIQNDFNSYFDERYRVFCGEIHECFDLRQETDFSNWDKEYLPVLPGELEGAARVAFQKLCGAVTSLMHKKLMQIYSSSPDLFIASISKLCGFDHQEINQLIYLYTDNTAKGSSLCIDYGLFNRSSVDYEISTKGSTVNIDSENIKFQVRVKAMNTFTSSAFKINCAFKFKQPALQS